jgi:hypothetical protein
MDKILNQYLDKVDRVFEAHVRSGQGGYHKRD